MVYGIEEFAFGRGHGGKSINGALGEGIEVDLIYDEFGLYLLYYLGKFIGLLGM